jgi:glycerol-3-phosphate dehydrogenase
MQRYFPELRFTVTGAFSGLRVLPRDRARPFERGRELILAADRGQLPRVMSLYGGKLTSYRADAARVMARLSPSLPKRPPRADTRNLMLSTG